jgi:Cellulase (glycosyl hydrolase family 5)
MNTKAILAHLSSGAVVVAVLGANPAIAQGTSAPASLPVGACMNIGNSLEPPQESAWGGEPVAAADFVRIKQAGFQTIRLPVRWHNKSSAKPPHAIDPKWMDRVALAVDQALDAGLNVILNSHHFDPIHDDPEGVSQWHGAVWEQISARFAGYPEDRLWFELENEPHKKFDNSNLLQTLEPAYRAVRAKHPTRPVIYGGENWSGIDSLATLPLPEDPNVYPTFHYYEPFDYTHQGASWIEPTPPPPGRRYGTPADEARLKADVAKIEAYVARTGKVPFMGESGAYDLHSPTGERVAYTRAVHDAFAPTGMGICLWGYANTFPIWDRKTGNWLPGMLAAMGLSAPVPSPTAPAQTSVPKNRDLPAALSELDGLLPGFLVNDPRSLDWVTYGDRLRGKPVVDPAIPGGGAAMKLETAKPGNIYDAGVLVPLIADIEAGRRYTIGFWARALSSDAADKTAQVGVRFQRNVAPYPGFGDTLVTIGETWQFHEVTAIADQTVSRSEALALFQVGARKQVVEIGQTIVITDAASFLDPA